MAKYLFEPTPNEAAVDFLKRKRPLNAGAYKQLLPELRAHAFTVSGLGPAAALKEVRDLVAGVPAGADYKKTRKQVLAVLAQHIPIEPDLFDDPEEAEKHEAALLRRAEMVVRNNAFQAYSMSAWRELDEFRDLFTHWQYITVGDGRVRASHKALDKVTLPQNHPFWQTHFPPWEFGCRCQVVGLTEDEYAKELEKSRRAKPEERWALEGEELERLENEGVIVRNVGGAPVRIEVTSARDRNEPGAWRWDPRDLSLSFADLRGRYDAQTFGMWEAWAKATEVGKGETVWDFVRAALGAAPAVVAPAVAPVAVVAPVAAVRTLVGVIGAMDTLTGAIGAQEAALNQLRTRLAGLALDAPEAPGVAFEIRERVAKLEALKDEAREAVSIPAAQRGKVKLLNEARTKRAVKKLPNWQTGQAIFERFVDASLMPEVSVGIPRDRRAFCDWKKRVHVRPETSASTVAHEITHAIEMERPEVVAKAANFLRKRSGADEFKRLRDLTGIQRYRVYEITFEDEWVKRGGSHYMGKFYFPSMASPTGILQWKATRLVDADAAFRQINATELLTMGIERLNKDPVEFFTNDPDYFTFLVKTLQNL
jgi:hypothetical protein